MNGHQARRTQCDVVVVGAGPGGSSAAYWLARAGVDVLLADRAHFPRNKPCGDGLTPGAVEMLQAMGLTDSLRRLSKPFHGVRIFAYGQRPFLFDLPTDASGRRRSGLVLPRRDLDDTVRRHAIAAGAHFLSGVTALEPLHCQERLIGLQGRHNDHQLIIEAHLIIVATGANRTLLKALNLIDEDRPSGLAVRAYVAGLERLDTHLDIFLDRELHPGYGWVFPIDDERANVGVGIRLGDMTTSEASRQLRIAFDRLLDHSRLAGAELLDRPGGYPLRTDFPAVPTSAAKVLIVGETAGLVDPLTGEGIGLALESGHLAAQTAIEALKAGDTTNSRLRQYDQILRERYADYFADTRELMGRLSHPKVLDTIIQSSRTDDRVKAALVATIMDERPREGIALITKVLHATNGNPSVKALFALNAYRPLLDRCRAYMRTQVTVDAPTQAVVALIERGKMLRALLVFLGCEAAGGAPEDVIAAAAGIELVHTASLIHDDIMDDADMRRGLPALHKQLGVSRAIVCGDYLIAKSFQLLAESRAANPASNVVDAFLVGADSGIRACAGQFRDVGTWEEGALDEEAYDELIAGKTAAAIAGALKAGAALAGADELLLDRLSRYGETVGRAFQISDDLLDFTTVAEGEYSIDQRSTLPLIHAFRHGDAYARDLIRHFLDGQPVAGHELRDVLHQTGSLTYARQKAAKLVEQSISYAETIPEIRPVLEAFAHFTIVREY